MYANRSIGGVRIPCVAFYIVAIILIFAYGGFRRRTGTKDFLEDKIIDHPSCPGFDGWAVAHFLFFGILGFLYPGHYLQCLIVSLGWEAFEHMLGTHKIKMSGVRLQLMGATDSEGNPVDASSDDEGENDWWYGRFTTDSFFNMAGYTLGSELGQKLWPPTKGDNVFAP